MKKIMIMFLVSAFIISFFVYGEKQIEGKTNERGNMKIKISFNNTELTATMFDNPTTRDFIKLLPLTLKLDDYAGTEKVGILPKKLSLKDGPSGSDPSIGDIAYYSPWGNLAIFYRNFSFASGLIIMGKLDTGISILKNCEDPCVIKIEKL